MSHNTNRLEDQNTYLRERINIMEQTITDVVENMRNTITLLNEGHVIEGDHKANLDHLPAYKGGHKASLDRLLAYKESHKANLDRLLAHTVTLKSLTTPTPTNDNIPF